MCELCLPISVSRRALLIGAAASLTGWSLGRSTAVSAAAGAVAIDDRVSILPRETWAGADRPSLAVMPPEDVRFLLVHHTAGANQYDEVGALEQMRAAYDHHVFNKGWPDVCYNFFIDRFGRVFVARAGSLHGSVVADATGGSQGFAQLVCLLGDFTNEMPTVAAIESLISVLAWLADREGIVVGPDASTSFISRGSNLHTAGAIVNTNTIAGHRSMSQTACPGDQFAPYVEADLPAAVLQRRSADATTTSTTVKEDSVEPPLTTDRAEPPPPETPISTTTADAALPRDESVSAPHAAIVPSPQVNPATSTTQSTPSATTGSLNVRPAETSATDGGLPGASPTWMPLGAVVLVASVAVALRARSRRPDDEPDV